MVDDDLVALEREGWQALSGPGGADFYRDHLDENALMAFPFGVMDRQQALEGMASAAPWSRFDLTEAKVLQLTEDVATVVYRVSAQREGQPEFAAVCSSAYVRRGGRWKLALHQQSPA